MLSFGSSTSLLRVWTDLRVTVLFIFLYIQRQQSGGAGCFNSELTDSSSTHRHSACETWGNRSPWTNHTDISKVRPLLVISRCLRISCLERQRVLSVQMCVPFSEPADLPSRGPATPETQVWQRGSLSTALRDAKNCWFPGRRKGKAASSTMCSDCLLGQCCAEPQFLLVSQWCFLQGNCGSAQAGI